jgi:hypothetical protein
VNEATVAGSSLVKIVAAPEVHVTELAVYAAGMVSEIVIWLRELAEVGRQTNRIVPPAWV